MNTVTQTFLIRIAFCAALIIGLAACAQNDGTADGGAEADGADGGSGGGCTAIADCSPVDPHKAVCLSGRCEALGGDQAPLILNIGFTYASEIRDSVTWFAYYALYPQAVDGSTLTCRDLINGRDPEGTDLNLIQTYRKQLIVTGDMMQAGTLYLPYITGMILFVRVFNDSLVTVGLACTPNVTVPGDAQGVGMTLCPADKIDRCLNLLPK